MWFSIASALAVLVPVVLTAPSPAADLTAVEGFVGSPALSPPGVGSFIIQNNCYYPIILHSVGFRVEPRVILRPGQIYREPYRHTEIGGGVSIKMTTFGDPLEAHHNITQLEYTLEGGKVWYDLSFVDGHAFYGEWESVQPEIPWCPSVTCQPWEYPCAEAYERPKDDWASHGCPQHGNIWYRICG